MVDEIIKSQNIMSVGFIEQRDTANEVEESHNQQETNETQDAEKQELYDKVLINGLALSTIKNSNPLADKISDGVRGRPGRLIFQEQIEQLKKQKTDEETKD